jgi:hypothetical protein
MSGASGASASREAAFVAAPAIRMPQAVASTDQPGASRAPESSDRRLLNREQVLLLLQLSGQKVQQLINTRQLTPFLIAGEERFDSRDVYHLIDAYMSTAARRPQ